MLIGALCARRSRPCGAASALAEGPPLRGALAPVAATIALLAVTQYGGNRVASSGEFLLDNLVPYDTAFHVGLARELTLGYPAAASRGVGLHASATTSGPTSCGRPRCAGRPSIPTTRSTAST